MAKRSYVKFPCEQCICLAICKGMDRYIICDQLYKYMIKGIELGTDSGESKRYYRIRKITNFFGRWYWHHESLKENRLNPTLLWVWEEGRRKGHPPFDAKNGH